MKETIKFAKVRDNAIIPTKTPENAGYDIYGIFEGNNDQNRILKPHQTKLIPTGIACALPQKYYFQVEERGSTGSKGIKKSAGVIDSGYRGEIFVALTNTTENFVIFGDKETYTQDAYAELRGWQSIDENNMTDIDKASIMEVLKNSIEEDVISSLSEEELETVMKDIVLSIKKDSSSMQFVQNIETAIFYPDTKAIAQLILHEVPDVDVIEISYDELKEIPSERQEGILGSSGK